MKNLFVANEIYDVVLGMRVKPEDLTTATGKVWVKDDAKAQFYISSTVESMQQQHIQACDSAKEMWDRLANIHEQRSATHKLLLTQRFHEYRMEPTDTVAVHVSKVQNMARQIVDLGENLPDIVENYIYIYILVRTFRYSKWRCKY